VATQECECNEDDDCAPGINPCAGTVICDKSGDVPACVLAPNTEIVCPPSAKQCTVNACSPATGACEEVLAPSGTPCSGTDLCVTGQTCKAGLCQGGELDSCDDMDACTFDACLPAVGCQYTPNPDCGGGEDKEGEFDAVQDVWLEGTSNKNGTHFLIAGQQQNFPKKRSLIQFDVSSIPKGATVTSASMLLWHQYTHGDDGKQIERTLEVYRVLKPWSETQATTVKASNSVNWMGPYLVPGFDFDPEMVDSLLVKPGESKQYDPWDITTAVQAWVDDPATNFGLLIRADNEDQWGGEPRFTTREGDAANVPRLEIEWTE